MNTCGIKNKNTATYTHLGRCTPIGTIPPPCPTGWVSVGILPDSCTIGNAPGIGHTDQYMQGGQQRVCKRTVPSSGRLAVDCCSNRFGIADSVECASNKLKPYSWECNNVMVNRCNVNTLQIDPYKQPSSGSCSNLGSCSGEKKGHGIGVSNGQDPYRNNWNGMPFGRDGPVVNPCSGQVRTGGAPIPETKFDEYCISYLNFAPPNNYFHNHNYQDYPHDFPKYSYTTPEFNGTWGYQSQRLPYYPYDDLKHKNENRWRQLHPNGLNP